MYYYGGYSGGYGNSCCQPTYCCPSYGNYGGYGYGNNFAIILVLFILLVIIIGSRFSL